MRGSCFEGAPCGRTGEWGGSKHVREGAGWGVVFGVVGRINTDIKGADGMGWYMIKWDGVGISELQYTAVGRSIEYRVFNT